MNAINNFLLEDTFEEDRDTVLDTCSAEEAGVLDQPDEQGRILTKSVMVLEVSNRGAVCIQEGKSIDLDGVSITARTVAKGEPGGTGTVQEIGIGQHEPWIYIAVTLTSIFLTLVVGSVIGVIFDRRYQGRGSSQLV